MPRSDELVTKAVGVGAAFLVYRMARQNAFGAGLMQFANAIHNAVSGISVSAGAGGVSVGAAPAGSTTPTGTTVIALPASPTAIGASQKCPDFITAVQYVADRHDGTFETVVGGRLIYVGDQATAQATYRHAFGCG